MTPPDTAAPAGVDVSVVTYNSAAHLDRLVESLAAQDCGAGSLRLVFVDNASSDGTPERLRALRAARGGAFAGFEIVENRRNAGFGRGHNAAQREGRAPFVFVLNPDTRLYPDCLSILLRAAARAGADVGAWEPRQVPYEHPKQYDPVSMEPPWCSGAALLVRRAAWEAVGGFDRRIFLYCEDVDLSWRLRRAGWRLRYVPSACLRHDAYDAPGQVKPAQFIHSVLGNLYLRTRFGGLRDMARGYLLYLRVLFGPKHFPGQRKTLAIIGIRYLRDLVHFLERRREVAGVGFHGFDYAPVRVGAFHEVAPWPDMDDPPPVSILIRTVGRRAQLRRALETVRNQTYRNIEAVVVEDGPATLETFLEGFADLDIAYRPLGENRGRCHAGNAAMAAARGEYLCFLDEDDELYADHVEQLVARIGETGARAAYATAFEVETRWTDGHEIEAEGPGEIVFDIPFSHLELCRRNYMPICAVLFERRLFDECGGFDPELEMQEDWNLWLRFSAAAGRFARIEKTTSLYRVPMSRAARAERHRELLDWYAKARVRHRGLEIAVDAGDLADEADHLAHQVHRVLGIAPHELAALEVHAGRRRVVRWSVALARRVLRPLASGR